MATRSPAGLVPDERRAYFFDIDGTLVEIARAPGDVRIDRRLRRCIERLHQATGGAVALITGRGLADVDRLFPGVRMAAAGQHGLERRTAAGRIARHRGSTRRLDAARRALGDAVARHYGLLLEDKGQSLALHYRRAPALGGYAHRLVRRLVRELGTRYCVQSGKRVVEIRPIGGDKGAAIGAFMRERPFAGRVPVFLGDDATDEVGFAVVNRLGGDSVKIGPGATRAHWRLRNAAATRGWLATGRPAPKATR